MMTLDEALMKADDANYSSETEITLAAEVRRLREENERLRKDAERMNGDIADLRQLIARYRERELTMGWNQE